MTVHCSPHSSCQPCFRPIVKHGHHQSARARRSGILLASAGFGFASLRVWARYRPQGFPASKVATHLSLQLTATATWIGFVFTGSLIVAWIAFALITIGQVFGDLLLFALYRARHPDRPHTSYLSIGGDVLSLRRPHAGFHALFGAIAWFGMLGICVYASIAD